MLTPQQIKEIEEFIEKLNNSAITGHISGRHLILVGGKQDREWTGGDYEESEYRFLDEYIKSFIITTINNILAERDKEIVEIVTRGFPPVPKGSYISNPEETFNEIRNKLLADLT